MLAETQPKINNIQLLSMRLSAFANEAQEGDYPMEVVNDQLEYYRVKLDEIIKEK